MKLLFHVFSLICIIAIFIGCSKDEGDDGAPTTSSDYQIKFVYQNDFILILYPIDLINRSTGATFQNVTTDEDGVFTLSGNLPSELIASMDIEGAEILSVLRTNTLQRNVINTIDLADITNYQVSGLSSNVRINIDSDSKKLEFNFNIPSYPMERAIVELFSSFDNLNIKTNPDQNGNVSIDIPLIQAQNYNVQVILKDHGNRLVEERFIQLELRKSYNANLKAEIVDCNDIKLIWDPYAENDFLEYQITYKDANQSSQESCNELRGLKFITDVNTNEIVISDYALSTSLCFNIIASTSFGMTNSTSITLDQPFNYFLDGDNVIKTDILANNDLILYYNDVADLSLKYCQLQSMDGSFTCDETNFSSDKVYTGIANGMYRSIDKNGDQLTIYDQSFQQLSNVTVQGTADFLHIVPSGFVVTYESLDSIGFRIVDLTTYEVGYNIPISADFDMMQFVNAPQDDQFGVVLHDRISLVDYLHIYNVTDKNNAILNNAIRLESAFTSQQYFSTPGGETVINSNGLVVDLTQVDGAQYRTDLIEFNISENYLNDQNVVIPDFSQNKMILYNYKTRSVLAEIDLCQAQILGLTSNDEIIISKPFDFQRGIDIVSVF